jgi:hypothetical protein
MLMPVHHCPNLCTLIIDKKLMDAGEGRIDLAERDPKGASTYQITPHLARAITLRSSDVPAQLGLKAAALARLSTALAFRIFRPGQSRQ